MASKDPLIRHAITPPAFEERTSVHRDRLVDSIHGNVPRKLIAIAAPAGYGKTTLLADFGSQTDFTVCWLRLTEAEWDVMRFAEVLAASLQSRFRRLRGQPDLEALANSSPEALAVAFTTAIDEQIADPFLIAVDDIHLINRSKPVLAFLDRFLEDMPEQTTVIAAGREVLEVSLARLMADRDLAGFGPHDLALTREELIELTTKQQGEPPPDKDIDRLLEESRGWVTGIVMSGNVADLGAGSLIAGGRPMVYEYLASVVLNRQPDELRRFALDASVLPIMTAKACNAILDRTDSQRHLTQLVRRNLFVTASEASPRTYEFHPLFREFLLESMQGADARHLQTLQRRAAKYHLEKGSIEQAVDLLLDAGSVKQAAKLADRHSHSKYSSGRVQTLERWEERLRDYHGMIPNLLLDLATAEWNRGHLDEAERLLNEVQECIGDSSSNKLVARCEIVKGFLRNEQTRYSEAIEAADRIDQIYKSRGNRLFQGNGLRIRAMATFHETGDAEAAERLAYEAVGLVREAGDDYSLAGSLNELAVIQDAQGKTADSRRSSRQVLELANNMRAPLPLSVATGNVAFDAHQQGDFESALSLAREALDYARRAASPLREAIAFLRQADVFNDLGLALQSAELYRQALEILMGLDNVFWIRYGCVQTSVLHRRMGGSGLAHEWLKRAMVLEDKKQAPAAVRIQLASLEIEAAPEQAIDTLRGLIRKRHKSLEAHELTLVYYFMARAAYALDNEGQAVQTLVEGLTQAGRTATEQAIAAEILFDSGFRKFVRAHYSDDPTVAVILSRVDTMRALQRKYEASGEETQAENRLSVKALGEASVRVNGEDVEGIKPLAREILFYVIDRGRVARGQLMENFWPDQKRGRQVSSLHTAIYSIRRELGKDSIEFDGTLYSVDSDMDIQYDVARFERAAAVGERLPPGDPRLMFALTEAVNLYSGSFLPEIDSEWVDERRRSLDLRYLDLLAKYSEEALVQGQPSQAVGRLREALRIDPLRDDTNRYYMQALGRLGRRSEIVTHYQEYVRKLSDELGLDPPADIRELYDRLIS